LKLRLQQFDSGRATYDRPNQSWVCGWTEQGNPCRLGPDARGNCRATFECNPIRKGDRWLCTRPESAGGPCTEGPRPHGSCSQPIPKCRPVRTLRAKRAVTTLFTIALTMGMLITWLECSW